MKKTKKWRVYEHTKEIAHCETGTKTKAMKGGTVYSTCVQTLDWYYKK